MPKMKMPTKTQPLVLVCVALLATFGLSALVPEREALAQDAAPPTPPQPKRQPPRKPRFKGGAPADAPAPDVAPVAPVAAAPAAAPAAPAKEALPLPALPGEKEFTECRRLPPGKKVVVILKPDSELSDLIGWIKTISCRPFIVPQNIRQAKVTIVVPEPITANEAYRIFLSSLESMGLTVQPEGQVLKIIESSRARESPIPVITAGREGPGTEQYITRLLRLNYVYPEDVVAVLNRLKGRDGDITPYAPTNTLVITDLATNIKRMEEVVRALDVPMGGEKIWVIRLKNVSAGEVAQMLQQIFGVGKGGGASGGQPGGQRRPPIQVTPPTPSNDVGSMQSGEESLSISQIFPDDRSNSLIIVATEKTYQRVLALVKRLEDQGNETGGGNRVHVYPLENANAEDLSSVLQGLGVSVSASRGGRSGARTGATQSMPSSGGNSGGSAGLFQDEVKVTADKATNSLVILAGGKDYLTLRDVIRRLDMPRRQVYIEATVMEISVSKARDLGASYHGAYDTGPGVVLGTLHNDKINSLNPLGLAALSGLAAGVIGTPIPTTSAIGQLGQSIPSFGVVLNALQTNNDVNILQVPNILTTDNEKATIQVGQNLPFPASNFGLPGAAAGGATGASSFAFGTSVQRQDVALKLEITPHVNASDYVRLEIDNEISDVAADNYNGLGPATNKRTLKTVAVVRDQQPIVLGGILRDKQAETETKIPLLGDIPILGYLFKIKRKTIDKQMLVVVLTPYVISEPGDLRRIFERKMKERREFIEAYSVFKSEQDFDKVVDYTRKRGALEEINRTALEAEREAMELRAAEQGLRRDIEAGPVELPAMPPRGHSGPSSGSLPPPPSQPVPPPPGVPVTNPGMTNPGVNR